MRFLATPLPGAFVVEVEPRTDERGFFGRSWCAEEFAAHGLDPAAAQVNVLFSHHRGTLRGMHLQAAPHEEAKLVRCTRGAIFDVAVDLRPASPTYCRWFGVELTADDYRMLYVPKGCAHGFLTLEDRVDVTYMASTPFAPAHAHGVRFDDPAFSIAWPIPVLTVNEKDRSWPLYAPTTREEGR